MSSTSKIAPALGLGGRFWRLQREVGQAMSSKSSSAVGQQGVTELNKEFSKSISSSSHMGQGVKGVVFSQYSSKSSK